MFTTHPRGITGEVPGRGGNFCHGCACLLEHLVRTHKAVDDYSLTVCDGDVTFDARHMPAFEAELKQLNDDAHRTLWQGAMLWRFEGRTQLVRGVAMLRGLGITTTQSPWRGLFGPNYACNTMATTLRLAMQANFCDPSVVNDDMNYLFRCLLATKGRLSVRITPCPCVTDAPAGATVVEEIYQQWLQERRWIQGSLVQMDMMISEGKKHLGCGIVRFLFCHIVTTLWDRMVLVPSLVLGPLGLMFYNRTLALTVLSIVSLVIAFLIVPITILGLFRYQTTLANDKRSFGLDANFLVQLVMPAVQIVLGSVFMTVCGFCCVLEVLACGGRKLTFQATMRSS